MMVAYQVADLSALAEKTGWPIGTIYSWRRRGSVPDAYIHEAANATRFAFENIRHGGLLQTVMLQLAAEQQPPQSVKEGAGNAPLVTGQKEPPKYFVSPGVQAGAIGEVQPGAMSADQMAGVRRATPVPMKRVAAAAQRLDALYGRHKDRLSPLWEALLLHLLIHEEISAEGIEQVYQTARLSGHVSTAPAIQESA